MPRLGPSVEDIALPAVVSCGRVGGATLLACQQVRSPWAFPREFFTLPEFAGIHVLQLRGKKREEVLEALSCRMALRYNAGDSTSSPRQSCSVKAELRSAGRFLFPPTDYSDPGNDSSGNRLGWTATLAGLPRGHAEPAIACRQPFHSPLVTGDAALCPIDGMLPALAAFSFSDTPELPFSLTAYHAAIVPNRTNQGKK